MFSLNKSSLASNSAVRQRDAVISTHKKAANPQNFESLSALMPANQAGMTMGSIPVMLDLSPLMSGFLHHKEEKNLVDIYKDIYLYDAIAGTAVDLLSFLPFSELTLRGLTDVQQRPFLESLERLNIYTLLPEVSVDYLVFGTFIGSLIFNQEKRIFIDIIPQDFKNCTITRLPFYGVDPIINVSLPKETVSILTSSNARIQQVIKTYGRDLIDKLVKGNIELDPLSTIYLPRRTMSNAEGISYYRRIIPLYFLEKNIFRGTLVESVKRQRAILHVMAGDLDWEPTAEDLTYISELFINADNDPLGAIIATRNGISTNDIRCLSGQTLINTNQGLIKIQDLVDLDVDHKTLEPGTKVDLQGKVKVRTYTGEYVPAQYWWYQGVKPTFNLALDDGTVVRATEEHQFLTILPDLKLGFVKLKDLNLSHYLLKPLSPVLSHRTFSLPLSPFNLPCMTDKLAYCLAIILNKGTIGNEGIRLKALNAKVKDQFDLFMQDLFGASALSSSAVVDLVSQLLNNPDCILQADPQSQGGFISGFLDSAGRLKLRKKKNKLAWTWTQNQIETQTQIQKGQTLDFDLVHALLNDLGLRSRLIVEGDSKVLRLSTRQVNLNLPLCIKLKNARIKKSSKFGIPSQLVLDFMKSRLVNQEDPESFYNDEGQVVRLPLNWDSYFPKPVLTYAAFHQHKLDTALLLVHQVSSRAHRHLTYLFQTKLEFHHVNQVTPNPPEPVYDLTLGPDCAPVFTANNVCVHNSGGDFWQIESVWNSTFPAKLKALNISEEFVNGSASVATMEASMSGFVEQLRSYRTMITRKLFYNKIFPLISLTNELYIDDQARKRADELRAKAGRNSDLSTLLYQIQDTSSLLIPEIDWEKNLKPEGDSTYIDILKTMTDAGVPVPIRAMAAAGGIKLDKVLRQSEDDLALRKRLAEYQDKIKELAPKAAAEEGGYEGYSAMSAMYQELRPEDQQRVLKDLQHLSKSSLYRQQPRPSILDRKFNPEITGTSKTGKPKLIYGQRTANDQANLKIIKAMQAMRKNNKTL